MDRHLFLVLFDWEHEECRTSPVPDVHRQPFPTRFLILPTSNPHAQLQGMKPETPGAPYHIHMPGHRNCREATGSWATSTPPNFSLGVHIKGLGGCRTQYKQIHQAPPNRIP